MSIFAKNIRNKYIVWRATMFKKLIAVVAFCLIPFVASANSLSSSFVPPSSTNSPGISNWTGPYGGLNLGAGVHDTIVNDHGAWWYLGGPLTRDAGVTGGGTVGYNWQFSSSGVIGVEADINGSSFNVNQADDWPTFYSGSNSPLVPRPCCTMTVMERHSASLMSVVGQVGQLIR
jgi:hypothetical protein